MGRKNSTVVYLENNFDYIALALASRRLCSMHRPSDIIAPGSGPAAANVPSSRAKPPEATGRCHSVKPPAKLAKSINAEDSMACSVFQRLSSFSVIHADHDRRARAREMSLPSRFRRQRLAAGRPQNPAHQWLADIYRESHECDPVRGSARHNLWAELLAQSRPRLSYSLMSFTTSATMRLVMSIKSTSFSTRT